MTVDSISVRGLAKRYGRQRALISIDLSLQVGRLCAVLGHNGAGKSTLLGILSTLVRATGGEVVFQAKGAPVPVGPELRRQIGVLADSSMLYGNLSPRENLRFYAGLYDIENADARIAELLDTVGLETEAHDRQCAGFSRGMTQRVALARVLLHNPSILLLDEPFTGLDQEGAAALGQSMAKAKADGRLLLVVTHDLPSIAGLADHVVVLSHGKVSHEARSPEGVPGFSHEQLRDIYQRHAA